MKQNTALITGASGFLGRNLAETLLLKGYRIKVLARDPGKLTTWKNKMEVVQADLAKPATLFLLKDALKDVDVVFHLAAIIHEVSTPKEEYHAVNAESTRILYELCKNTPVQQFIFSSSVVVYGSITQGVADEHSPCNPENAYASTKLEAEKSLERSSAAVKIPYTILRFSKIYGPGDAEKYWLKLYRMIKKKRFLMIGDGTPTMMPVYIQDAVHALQLCMDNPKAYNQCYNIAGSELVTKGGFIDTISECFHVRKPRPHIPKSLVIPPAMFCEGLCKLLGKEPPLSRKRLRFFFSPENYSIAKAQRDLHYSPQTSLKKGMQATVEWLQKSGHV